MMSTDRRSLGPIVDRFEGWDAPVLLDVSLILATSAPLGQDVEAFSAPAHSTVAVSPATPAGAQAAWSAALDASAARTGVHAVPVDQLPRLGGDALLGRLGELAPSRIDGVLQSEPGIVSKLLASPPSASATAATWSSWSPATRRALETASPRLVGSLEGVPYSVRDRANRTALRERIDAIESRIESGAGRAVSADLRTRLHMLEQVRAALKPTDGIHRQLIAFDTVGQGRAIIAIGDVDTADYVSFLVPGMYYGVDARVVPWTGIAASLASEQQGWLDRNDEAHRSTAVLSWIGYETPTLVDVASMTDAREGSRELSRSLDGLRASRASAEPFVSLLAHSYGATAAMLAVDSGGSTVDALAIVGAPGSPAAKASDLGVRNANVWVGAASWDPIAQSGVFGSQPTSAAYGARAMGVGGGKDPVTGERLVGTVSHNDYFSPDSETLRNFALIGVGADGDVLQPDGRTFAQASRDRSVLAQDAASNSSRAASPTR